MNNQWFEVLRDDLMGDEHFLLPTDGLSKSLCEEAIAIVNVGDNNFHDCMINNWLTIFGHCPQALRLFPGFVGFLPS